VIMLDLKTYGGTVFQSQIISINLPLPSHLSVIAEDLLLSSLCDNTLKLFVTGETINQEIANIARAIAKKTFQLFILPPSQKSSGHIYLKTK
tara:strand:+ start:132 stop:407 length:276 start_codon:yes stop_codon:yes gene_type:complete